MASRINFLRARDGASVTPNDSTDLPRAADALYIGSAGDVEVITDGGTTLTFSGLTAGSVLPVACSRVRATNTTATLIIALFE